MNINRIIENQILSKIETRNTYLKIFADSILHATECKSDLNWTVHHEEKNNYLRFTIGQHIVCSIENNSIWLALCVELLESKPLSVQKELDVAIEWSWGPKGTEVGEYRNPKLNIKSRNGYYKLHDNARLTSTFSNVILPLHLGFLDKLTKKNYKLRKKRKTETVNYTPELLDYVELHTQCSLPRPSHGKARVSWPPPLAGDTEEPSGPERVETKVYRILRDTKLATEIKQLYGYNCQLCDTSLQFPNGQKYAEAHHIKPLGKPHKGPDVKENIICVCPNCHAQLDYFAIKLERSQITAHENIGDEYINYHNQEYARQFHP